jgi:hypothetical protein
MRKFSIVAGLAVWAIGTAGAASPAQAAAPPEVAFDWNDTAVSTIRAGAPFQAQGLIYMAYVEAAVYDAVTAIEGGYQQYQTNLSAPDGASPEAAVAAAAHRTLVTYFPAQSAGLDAKYAASLAGLPSGKSRDDGEAVGEQAAQAIISLRAADVRSGNGGYTIPAPGPGVWALPTADSAATTPQTPWIAKLQPFMLKSPSQFRPDEPNAITSEKFLRDLAETESLGGASSTARTPEETLIARFWTANVINQYNVGLRAVATQHAMDLEQTVRLLAMGDTAIGDAAIACWDAKYAYSFWRPIQAVRAMGNDQTWKPLLAPTPNHPEYPSAHGCVTSAFAVAVSFALDTRQIRVDMPGLNPQTGLFDSAYTRHFNTVRDMTSEVENARVWGGLHFRDSVEAGVELGTDVVRYDLSRNFRATNDDGNSAE